MPDREGPDAVMLGHLRAAAGADGFVPFDRYMELALYAEGVGYYDRGAAVLGPRGDFYTAAHLHPVFARTLARRLLAIRQALGPDRPFEVVEVGAGDGELARGILAECATAAATGGPVRYTIVERSASLRARALERARGVTDAIPVRALRGLGDEGPVVGAIVANEVLDAQPTRRLRWTGRSWLELGVRVADGGLAPVEVPMARPELDPPLVPPTDPGQIVEVAPGAEALVREVGDHLASGVFLAIDYGMDESELRAAHPNGTLAAVRHHREVEDVLAAPGTADLSTFVNFSRIRAAARSAGLVELAFERQAEALGRWGYSDVLDDAIRTAGSSEAEVRVRLASKNLLFGFERFRVLELSAAASADRFGGTTVPAR
jgi:SAM-dependent MidA family methyltransferase